jgi:SAM-dependent methyltransferase
MENVQCNLCGSKTNGFLFDRQDRFSSQTFRFVVCSQCGLIFLNPRPSEAEIDQYYPQNYEAFQHPDEVEFSKDIRRATDLQLGFVERFAPSRGNLLDVGCATGNFILAAQNRGWKSTGIELVESAALIGRGRGLNVKIGTLETTDWNGCEEFNLITLWDVLEHLPDPKGALKRCYNLLIPSGVLVFTIPNLRSFDRYLFGRAWIGWDAPRHFYMFDNNRVSDLLSLSGFQIIDTKCLLGGKGTFLLSLDFLFRNSKLVPFINMIYPLMSILFWPYRQFSYLLKRGPIITIVARKNPEYGKG